MSAGNLKAKLASPEGLEPSTLNLFPCDFIADAQFDVAGRGIRAEKVRVETRMENGRFEHHIRQQGQK